MAQRFKPRGGFFPFGVCAGEALLVVCHVCARFILAAAMAEQFRYGQAQFVGSLRESAQSVAVVIESGFDAEQRL
jgi:hypothetical protein